METIYELLHRLVADHPWKTESEKVAAHGVVNRSDPNYRPPVNQNAGQNLTPEQMMIAQLQQQLAEARGQQYVPANAAQQMQQAYGPQPTSAAAANPQDMRGYAYPVPNAQGQPVQQTPVAQPPHANPAQMTQYAYPVPQPETGYQPVANPFIQQ